MMAIHPMVSEPITVKVKTRNRGVMLLDLQDSAQFPLFYNIYEWKDEPTIVRLLEGTRTVLDIGANIGQMALLLAQHAKRVVAFEPVPNLAARVREQVLLNGLGERIEVREEALSNAAGELRLELGSEENGGNGSLITGRGNAARSINVKTARLDDLVEVGSMADIDLIKMDIEGAELFALEGMTTTLERNRPIMIVEMNKSMMKLAGYDAAKLLKYFGERGYSCHEFTAIGLSQAMAHVEPETENYVFLHESHLTLPKIRALLPA